MATDWVHPRGNITRRMKGGRREVRCLFPCPVPLQLWSSIPTSTAPFSWASSGIKFPPGGTSGLEVLMAPAVRSCWVLLCPSLAHSPIPTPISVYSLFIRFSSIQLLEVLATSFWVPGPSPSLLSPVSKSESCESWSFPPSPSPFYLLELCLFFTPRVSTWPKPGSWMPASACSLPTHSPQKHTSLFG